MEARVNRQIEEQSAYGVLRRSLPYKSPKITTTCDEKFQPFDFENEADDGSPGSNSAGDKVSGDMLIKTSAHYDGSTNWARCLIGQTFTARANNAYARCLIRTISDPAVLWGTFGVQSQLRIMLSLFLSNTSQGNKVTLMRKIIYARSRGGLGVVGGLQVDPFINESGRDWLHHCNPGDKFIVTAMLTLFAVAPLGYAGMDYRGDLLSLSLCHET